jgi:hypothetical protein
MMRWDGTITPATIISAVMFLVVIGGGLKFWYKILILLGEYPPHRHDNDEGITYPRGMAPERKRSSRA